MSVAEAHAAAPRGLAARHADHAVPLFEGVRSRRHVRRSVLRLRVEAEWLALRHARNLAGARVLVQFAGWPRSGHSLIGALIDAHPGAVVSHELDLMGLFAKGVPARRLPALVAGNAAAFTRSGRWWNGLAYAVPGAPHGPARPVAVVGDKKGDWATRWSAHEPGLVARLAAESALDCRWILVVRHPLDNIATLSLRRGGAYDRLRIAGEGASALAAAQADGRVPDTADDAMIDDYAALAAGVAAMKARVPADRWLEVVYEAFAQAPVDGLGRLARFVGLEPDAGWADAAAALVRPAGTRGRDRVAWRDDQRARVTAIVAAHDFLAPYADAV